MSSIKPKLSYSFFYNNDIPELSFSSNTEGDFLKQSIAFISFIEEYLSENKIIHNDLGINANVNDFLIKDPDIHIIFFDNKDLLDQFSVFDKNETIGFHCVTNPDFKFYETNSIYNNKHEVYVYLNEDYIQDLINNSKNKDETTIMWLTTISHEVLHCIDFIKNSLGHTPESIAKIIEKTNSNVSLNSLTYGDDYIMEDHFAIDDIIDTVEERVESDGKKIAQLFIKNKKGG